MTDQPPPPHPPLDESFGGGRISQGRLFFARLVRDIETTAEVNAAWPPGTTREPEWEDWSDDLGAVAMYTSASDLPLEEVDA